MDADTTLEWKVKAYPDGYTDPRAIIVHALPAHSCTVTAVDALGPVHEGIRTISFPAANPCSDTFSDTESCVKDELASVNIIL